MLPVSADVNDTFVQALATIGLSVADGFVLESMDESVRPGSAGRHLSWSRSLTSAGDR
jgi:hypothetical protein